MSLQRIKMRVVQSPSDRLWRVEVQSQDLENAEVATGLSMGFASRAEAVAAMQRIEEQGQRGELPGQTSKPRRGKPPPTASASPGHRGENAHWRRARAGAEKSAKADPRWASNRAPAIAVSEDLPGESHLDPGRFRERHHPNAPEGCPENIPGRQRVFL